MVILTYLDLFFIQNGLKIVQIVNLQ